MFIFKGLFTLPLQQMVNSIWIPKITKQIPYCSLKSSIWQPVMPYMTFFNLYHPIPVSPKLHQQRDSQERESRKHWKGENNLIAIGKTKKDIIYKLHVICKDYTEHVFTYLYTFVYRGSLNVGELKIFLWML